MAGINKYVLQEIKSLPNPPDPVHRVMKSVVILVDGHYAPRNITSRDISRVLGDMKIAEKLQQIDGRNISDKQIKRIQALLGSVTAGDVSRCNLAAGFLFLWIIKLVS